MSTAVHAEALQLWPPSWMFSRRVTEPLTLGGCTVPTGTMCLISPALLQRDPRWWTEPDQFRPQRWLRHEPGRQDSFDPSAPASRGAPSCPSVLDPRMCIGEQFTWAEAATVLAELGRTWRIQLISAPPVPVHPR